MKARSQIVVIALILLILGTFTYFVFKKYPPLTEPPYIPTSDDISQVDKDLHKWDNAVDPK